MGEDQSGTKEKRETRCIVCACVVNEDRPYYKRYRTCRSCASRERVMLKGSPHRFCQQCGKYEPLECFDVGTRTCRVALARHAERRRMASEKRRQCKKENAKEENGRPLKKQANVFYPKVLRVGSADPVEAVLAEEKRTAIFESAASACVKQKTIQNISNGSTIPPSQVLAMLHSIIRSFFFATENGSGDVARSHVGEVNNGKPSSESTESTGNVGQQARRPVGAPRYTLNDKDMQHVIEILKWCFAASDQSKHPNAHS